MEKKPQQLNNKNILRARVCIKCQVYIIIHPHNPKNIFDIKKFETIHKKHTLITMASNEIKENYKVENY